MQKQGFTLHMATVLVQGLGIHNIIARIARWLSKY